MSNHCYICKLNENNGYINTAIYCHYNGYPSYMMPILTKFYNTATKVDELLELGALSRIGESLEPSPLVKEYCFDYDTNPAFNALPEAEKRVLTVMDQRSGKHTNAYHRDGGETLVIEAHAPVQSIVRRSGIDFIYIWYKNKWFYFNAAELENCSSQKLLELLNKELEC